MQYKVYLDMVFFVNTGMDILLLLLMKYILHKKGSYLSIFLSGVLGGLGACVLQIICPYINTVFQLLLYFLLAMGMSVVAFREKKWVQAIWNGIRLFFLSYFFAGIVGFWYGRQDQTDRNFLIAVGVAAILVLTGEKVGIKRKEEQFHITVSFFLQEKTISLKALLDSGNGLYDPVSGKPVVIIKYQEIKSIFPNLLKEVLEEYYNEKIFSPDKMRELGSLKIRMVPYETIGSKNQLLLCISGGTITFHEPLEKEYKNVLWGITDTFFQIQMSIRLYYIET